MVNVRTLTRLTPAGSRRPRAGYIVTASTRPAATGRVVLILFCLHVTLDPSLAVPATACAAQQSPIETQDPEQSYIDALRERKLFRLLVNYCRRQLDRPDVTPTEQARYTIELANILAFRAQVETQTATRTELWGQASQLLGTFLDRNDQHPQAPTLKFQIGIYELAQGELGRQQAKLAPQNQELIETTRRHLNSAIQAFQQVDKDVTSSTKKSDTAPSTGAGPAASPNQLRTLASNARYRMGQALLALAQTYPRNSADQTDAASRAKVQFEEFTPRYGTHELTLQSFLGRAECLRLLGDPSAALKGLRDLEKPETPDVYLDRALVLRAQLQMDQKKPAAARDFIDEARKLLKAPSPEMDLLYVQSLLELAREQSKGQGNLVARQLVASALEEIDRVEQEHGPYWVGRCELLLADLAAENVLVEDPAVLVRMADGQFRRGDRSGTVRSLDRAVKLAGERGDADQTVEWSFRAASILVQEKDFEAAAGRFARIAATFANHPVAPRAHFMVVYCLGQGYAARSSPERLADYERSLEQHLRAFESDESASEVRWLLGLLRANQRRWPDAVELFKGISNSHKRFQASRDQMRRTYESWLQDLSLRGRPAEPVVAEAIAFMKQSLGDRRGKRMNPEDVAFALSLARVEMHPNVARYQEAEEILDQILYGQVASDTDRSEARRLIVAAQLGQDKFDQARQLIETEFVGVPRELFAIVQSLEDAANRGSESRRRQIGKLQLVATERLAKEAEQLTPEQSLQAEIYLALAYVNGGQAARADELFAKLHDRAGNDPRVLEAQAECFMQLGRHSQARELWRQLLGLLRENTPAWYRAKYNIALACFRSGDSPQALKIIQVTELLHPDLGGPEMKAKFEDLKAKCRG